MYRSSSPYSVRNIAGHGWVIDENAGALDDLVAVLVVTLAAMPGIARVAEPGLVAVIAGSGAIMIAPVSVCHHVSTTGQRSPPTTV